jgi:predicted RNA-binding Zn ribbon-like protein
MNKIRSISELPVDSTRLCCNFVNTVFSWAGDDRYDFFQDYEAFIEWCEKLDFLDKRFLRLLLDHANKNPDEANRAMYKIRKSRLTIHDIISATANSDKKEISAIMSGVNSIVTDSLSHIQLEYAKNKFNIAFPKVAVNLNSPLWIIGKSLYDLMTEDDLTRVRECPGCGWVFYDETKNGKRRWCNPLNCGTKDKMDRYRSRKMDTQ